MVKIFLLLLLLASPLSAQVITDIYVTEPKISEGQKFKKSEYPYADVIIVCDKGPSYILYSTNNPNTITITVTGVFETDYRQAFQVNKYGIESIRTVTNGNRSTEITIKPSSSERSDPFFADLVDGNRVIIRLFKKSEPYIFIVDPPSREIGTFPVKVAFKCSDPGKRESDTLEYRFFIEGPQSNSWICGYQPKKWTPWLPGDTGSVVLDSLIDLGEYTITAQSRNPNSRAESKKLEFTLKYRHK